MRQLIQNFKSGQLKLEETARPLLREGYLLVESRFSLISSATERSTVDTAKTSLLGKARKRPDLVRQVLENIKKEGLLATLEKVKNRLDTPKALGYSSSGVVIESRDFEGRFRPGDRVACAGQDFASHAEVVAVPQNLAVKIPDKVSFEEAAFTTVGAIALQGVRQADPKIGERIAVIGLGLIGQLTHQILRANGCWVFGIDKSGFAIETAQGLNIDSAIKRDDQDLFKSADSFTNGFGFDKVIITASCPDNDPIIVSTQLLRKKGLMVMVGNVRMDIPREPDFYKKELELKIATSYGPGRYDPVYEETGLDYPYPYVRFTENRNMEVFLELLSKQAVEVKPLISRIFDFEKALEAYDLILDRQEKKFIGILLKYKEEKKEQKLLTRVAVNTSALKKINIGFIGAGNFAQGYLLPHLKGRDLCLETVVTTSGIGAKNVAEKFGFNSASTEPRDIIGNKEINTVFIATRHDSHAGYVCEALKARKNVFVEKPLCLDIEELKEIISSCHSESILMVGFNRRFSPLSALLKEELNKFTGPLVMDFRINAGYVPKQHWTQDEQAGGGRIIGEVCHFIDLMLYYSNSKPKRVCASSIKIDSNKWRTDDNLAVNIEFENGSLGNIVYTAMGDRAMGKERLEIFAEGNAYLINDFKEVLFYKGARIKRVRKPGKGHRQEIDRFIDAVRNGKEAPIDFQSLLYTTLATIRIKESLEKKSIEEIDISELYP